jgi:hypothetical protein
MKGQLKEAKNVLGNLVQKLELFIVFHYCEKEAARLFCTTNKS